MSKSRLLLASMLAMVEANFPSVIDWRSPDAPRRHTEHDKERMRKAQEKRMRKSAKRTKS